MTPRLPRALAALTLAGALAGCATIGTDLAVREVGSYHVGGRAVTLSGLPIRELSFTPGAPPLKIDPNGNYLWDQLLVPDVLERHHRIARGLREFDPGMREKGVQRRCSRNAACRLQAFGRHGESELLGRLLP